MNLKVQSLHLRARQDLSYYKTKFMPNSTISESKANLKSNNGDILIKEEV